MENITSAGGEFWINNNDLLIDMNSFENLTEINGDFNIINNALLVDIAGFQNINPNSIDNLGIFENPGLSECHIQNICDYLAAPAGTIEIYNNAPGCNNLEEVESACFPNIEEEEFIAYFTISPNPCKGKAELQFALEKAAMVKIELFEVSGLKIKQIIKEHKSPGTHGLEIDLTNLQAGIYFCVFKTNTGSQTTKIIKL